MTSEFLIRRKDGDWFTLHKDQFLLTLKPNTIESAPTVGWGDHRIKTANGEIFFSYEDPGIQIAFEEYRGDKAEMEMIVNEILQNIEKTTGEKGHVVAL